MKKTLKEKKQRVIVLCILLLIGISITILLNGYNKLTEKQEQIMCGKIEVTSICMEYAKAESVEYDPIKKTYSFNNLEVSENVLIASCKN
jgi:hypothetical protein